MKNFNKWLQLRESMDVHIGGYSTSSNIYNIEDICHQLILKVLNPFWEKLTPKQQEELNKKMRFYDIIGPDGIYYHDETPIINFYTAGWPESTVEQMIQGIKYYLDSMHVKYKPFRKEKSGMYQSDVVRIEILQFNPTKDAPPRLNMSNDNAHTIMQMLNIPEDNGGYTFSARDILIKIDNLV